MNIGMCSPILLNNPRTVVIVLFLLSHSVFIRTSQTQQSWWRGGQVLVAVVTVYRSVVSLLTTCVAPCPRLYKWPGGLSCPLLAIGRPLPSLHTLYVVTLRNGVHHPPDDIWKIRILKDLLEICFIFKYQYMYF